ncbi:MAG: ATP-dependent DNA ligase [Acidimicrobiales bacterium]
MDLPVMPPVKPMLAKAVDAMPDGAVSFEPKWDGFRCIIFRDGDDIELGSRNERPLTRYFPELLDPLRDQLPDRCVVDSEVIVELDDQLDFDALQQRIHPADSRVNMLAEKTPATIVAFDLLALGDDDLTDQPFEQRRTALESIAGSWAEPLRLTPATTDREVAADWFVRFEGAGLDGLIMKPQEKPYVENKRTQFKLKHVRTADCVVAGFRIHKSGDGVGSLLLGLHDEDGQLHHLGVAASFTAKRRVELLEELKPYRLDDIADHPWADWLEAEAHADGRMPGAPNRWSGADPSRDHSWIPIRPDLVVEVKYVQVTNGRFRGTTRMVRWRPDRDPDSCRYDQLETPEPIPVSDIFAAG